MVGEETEYHRVIIISVCVSTGICTHAPEAAKVCVLYRDVEVPRCHKSTIEHGSVHIIIIMHDNIFKDQHFKSNAL